MKKIVWLITVLFLIGGMAWGQGTRIVGIETLEPSQEGFDANFQSKTLRIDYMLGGNSSEEQVFLWQMKQEPNYGGPHKNLIDTRNSGTYRYAAYDSATGSLLFSRGFCTLFQEWKGTPEAKKIRRVYPMTCVMPFPKHTIRFTIDIRDYKTGEFGPLFEIYINPTDYFINRESITPYKTTRFIDSGDPSNHPDIAFIAEGYTKDEMRKFRDDARRMADYIRATPPFSEFRDKINFYAIESPSVESGIDIPGTDIYANTNINSSFYTFDMDRYLTTPDTRAMYDIAANAPYDAFIVLVNSSQYGGGGFYNHYCESTVNHPLSEIVTVHEFGHAFGGLADEYYTSEVTYSDFYNLEVEPWEPNITTNVHFETKWKDMIDSGTPIPTPRDNLYKGKVGMFEGGGYVGKGVYSPVMDCRMKTNEAEGFCPVCKKAIRQMLEFYCD